MSSEFFVGRKREMQELKDLLKKKTASFVVVKGRRRIGKSRLLDEFSKELRSFKFTGLAPQENTTKQSQLDEFSQLKEDALKLSLYLAYQAGNRSWDYNSKIWC